MKLSFVFIMVLSFTQAKAHTTKSIPNALAKKVAKSKAVWKKLKKQWNNSYMYVNSYTSGEGGFTTKTVVTVKNGKVVSAYIKTINYLKKGEDAVIARDELSGEDLKKIYTLDAVYAFAESDLVKKSAKENYITFRVFDNGLISAAGFFPKLCADDCYEGFTFEKVVPLK